MSGFFDDPPPARPRAATASAPPQRSRALIGTAVGDANEVNAPGGARGYEIVDVTYI